ncbi:Gfo/Idh/MocA family oxidoreductase [Pelagibacteraceae bacterium]|nr:Gfo/Idh/MocA family oxidoreductase [Pelagibacteraceae bacterium]
MKNFVMVGASGYISSKHFEAIKKTNNNLVAAYDPNQNAGKIDSFFKDCEFFFNYNDFLNYIKKNKKKIDYFVICSPNYLHYKYIILGLRLGFNIICEKPLVLKKKNIKKIIYFEKKYKKKVNCIMQLRLNSDLIKLKKKIEKQIILNIKKKYDVQIDYFTFRGSWFLKSWKGDIKKSGGLATNIGIHLFDLVCWFFGKPIDFKVLKNNNFQNYGNLFFNNANVKWKIYIKTKNKNQSPRRLMFINKIFYDLSKNFSTLHVKSYKYILNNKGFSAVDSYNSISLVEKIRNSSLLK